MRIIQVSIFDELHERSPKRRIKSIASEVALTSTATDAAVYACAPDTVTGDLAKCSNSSTVDTEQLCYCDTDNCNDISQCKCFMGDGYTPYANKAKNDEWAEAENGAPRQVIATAFATVLSAVGAFWLL